MSKFEGLQACGSSFNDFCVTKSIQFASSVLLFGATFYQLCTRIRRQRQINFFVIVSIEMQLSLLCNLLFCWFHKTYDLYDFQIFFFSAYFITIVYQVALRLVEKSFAQKKIYWALIHFLFLIFLLANIAFLILRLANLYAIDHCNDIWVVAIEAFGIVLTICMIVGGRKYQKMEKQKLSGVYKQQHIKNPMPNMWKWIAINIFCQVLGLGETIYLQFSPLNNCTFSSNQLVQAILNLFFDIFSYHLGMFATFWFLRSKYRQSDTPKRTSLRKDSMENDSNNIQLVTARFSQRQ